MTKTGVEPRACQLSQFKKAFCINSFSLAPLHTLCIQCELIIEISLKLFITRVRES